MPLAVCATPIGNLDDVTLRVLGELAGAETILCEDTRRTRILLHRHEIRPAQLVSYREHNEAQRVAEYLPRLEAGARIALVTDAGLPGISDPGARLVGEALNAGVPVTVLPGASAVETALVASGYAGGAYRFVGFLPRGDSERRTLWRRLADADEPVVAFESPRRLAGSLASLAVEQPARRVAVCRELTKVYEETIRGTAAELAERLADGVKGEVTVVLAPTTGDLDGLDDDRADTAKTAVAELVAAGTPRRAAVDVVARLTGLARNTLYRDSL